MKKKKSFAMIVVGAMVIVALLGSCLVSYLVFDTANPFYAAKGFFQVTLADADYVEIRQSPKIILAQPNSTAITEYMESRGFWEVEEEQLGALRVFSNGEEKEWVMCSVNGYYSKWVWENH